MNSCLAECIAAYNLLDIRRFDGILRNILEQGMPSVQQQVLTKRGVNMSVNDPYKVLGVSPDATDDEVKAAYRSSRENTIPITTITIPCPISQRKKCRR